jgi:hypothetical protein
MQQVKNNTQYVRASFQVRKEVLDEFRKVVAKKYGKLWGCLCLEFEKALTERLSQLEKEAD